MGLFKGKFDSAKQEWETPLSLFRKLDTEFNFTLDLAADELNKKCSNYISKDRNSLSVGWSGVCWLNPPYGGNRENKLQNWIVKAYESTKDSDTVVVMLIPARTNTKWWHQYCMKAKEIRFIEGRPRFGGAKHGLPQPLALIVFAKHIGDTKFSSFKE